MYFDYGNCFSYVNILDVSQAQKCVGQVIFNKYSITVREVWLISDY